MHLQVWKSLLVEFVGTFVLVFIGGSAVAWTLSESDDILVKAFAFGLALIALIYMWGKFSGAHFNPAVSFGFALSGQMHFGLMLGYWIAQILGGIAAGALVMYLFGSGNAGQSVGTLTNTDAWKAVLVETLLTFVLVGAYLYLYSDPENAMMSGLVIGLVLIFAMMAGGTLTGASMNPARSLGPAIFGNTLDSVWIYIVGPLFGAILAVLMYKLLSYRYGCCYKKDECGEYVKDECGNHIVKCKIARMDKCGKPVKDECCNQIYDEIETVVPKKGFTQERKPAKTKVALTNINAQFCGSCDSPVYVAAHVDAVLEQKEADKHDLADVFGKSSQTQGSTAELSLKDKLAQAFGDVDTDKDLTINAASLKTPNIDAKGLSVQGTNVDFKGATGKVNTAGLKQNLAKGVAAAKSTVAGIPLSSLPQLAL